MKPHKHCEFIKAWADGHEIQFRAVGKNWTDCDQFRPSWYELHEYRVKPKIKTYRLYLDALTGQIGVANDGVIPTTAGRWLGDWQEVEV